MKSDISAAITKLIDYNEIFASRGDFTLIHMWLNEGCDLNKDILPAINEMTKRNKNITTVNYFAPLVFKKRDNRQLMESAKKDIPFESFDVDKLISYQQKGIPLSKAQIKFMESLKEKPETQRTELLA